MSLASAIPFPASTPRQVFEFHTPLTFKEQFDLRTLERIGYAERRVVDGRPTWLPLQGVEFRFLEAD